MNYELKVLERQAVEAARLARKMSRSLRSKIDCKQGTNQLRNLNNLKGEWYVWDDQRKLLRKQLRIMHLTRAYLSGKNYSDVEQKTWNPVDEWELWSELNSWYTSVSRQDVERWLYEAD